MYKWKFVAALFLTTFSFLPCTAQSPGFQASAFDFGVAPVGHPAGVAACPLGCGLPVYNTGSVTLTLTSVSFAGTAWPDFRLQSRNFPMNIAPGQMTYVIVSFIPKLAGLRAETLVVQDNAPGSPHQISLTGMGIGAGDLGVSANAGPSVPVAVSAERPVSYDLGLVVAAGDGFTGTITLSCSGLPQGANCSFPCSSTVFRTCFPAALVGPQLATTTMTLSTSKSTPLGTHSFTVTATFGNTTRRTQLTFSVN